MVSMVFWVAGVLCLLLAWESVREKGLVLGLEPLAWYWNALVLGVLAMGGKGGHGCGSCAMPEGEEKAM